ncbi:two-component sensor histidine kinase [Stenotrophomonas sp. ISL-67]|uniref:sensor histidine kinase n=1 Tax=Stenotrophomonas sp. ISL-67 TaxID=2819171 RepID=UPI001BE9CDA4|nr:ATP-binding protein [Stenotrophomonas sp. ISL-67]MBT2766739.1 two-component sensor histidine kinase [Stenotrophomonas sp. ISL-67]
MKSRSLNTQFVLVIIGVTALFWMIAVTVVLTKLSLNRTSTWDERLAAIATQLLVTIPADGHFDSRTEPSLTLPPRLDRIRGPLAFQVWVDRSRLLASTPSAPRTALRPDFVDGPLSTHVESRNWRVYSASDSTGRVTVQVGNLQSVVDADMRHKAMGEVVQATLLLVVVGITMWIVTLSALKPVRALGEAMHRRPHFDFTPLPLDGLPKELSPLVESFNHVLQQLDEAIEGERRFIGDAAHELRTPLSTLQGQAEIALREDDPKEKDEALRKLLTVAQHSTRLSEQLLDLARINAGAKAPRRAPADLSQLVQHVAQEFEVHASQNERSLFLNLASCTIMCDIDEIGILLRNLLHNAMRYTAEGGHVLIRCGNVTPAQVGDPPMVFLEVADNGPGVPAADRDAIFERFHRVANTPVRGIGIGLSLVAGIVASHRAVIQTGTGLEGRGLLVRVTFPARLTQS